MTQQQQQQQQQQRAGDLPDERKRVRQVAMMMRGVGHVGGWDRVGVGRRRRLAACTALVTVLGVVQVMMMVAVMPSGVDAYIQFGTSEMEECTREMVDDWADERGLMFTAENGTKLTCRNTVRTMVKVSGNEGAPSGAIEVVSSLVQGTTVRELWHPMKISVTAVLLRTYPVSYVQWVNNLPFEKVVQFQGTFVWAKCRADRRAASSENTCGFAFDQNGEKIRDSEGFCCDCTVQEFFGTSRPAHRGDIGCQLAGGTSAHCLRADELNYAN